MNHIQHIREVEVFALPHFILSNYTDIKEMRASFDLTEHGRWLADYVTVEHRFREATTAKGLYSVIYDVKAMRGMLLIYDKRVAALFKLTFASEEAA